MSTLSSTPGGPARRRWLFPAAVALILLSLPAGYFAFLHAPAAPPAQVEAPPSPPVEAPAPQGPVEVRLAEVQGTVELRQPDGTWKIAAQGDLLKSQDAVRTQHGSMALLVGGEAWEVRLESGTEVAVDDLAASISKIMLESGMATAKVRGEARHTFEVRAAGSDAVARTSAAEFAISSNGAGTVAVGARDGEVALSGAGRVVIVRSGQQSVVRPGQGPSEPTAVPSSLLLKVKWPEQRVHKTRRLVIAGEVDPGAHVEVAGQVVRPDADGHFRHVVQGSEGRNRLEVKATSVGGARAQDEAEVRVDTRAPKVGLDDDLWGVKKTRKRR
jgi:hypothetical protein